MKYRVTEKHPVYKTDTIISVSKDDKVFDKEHDSIPLYELQYNGQFHDHVLELCITEMLENEWIEEIQEPEFTKRDMKLFGAQCAQEWEKHKLLYVGVELDKFIKSK